MKKLLLLLTCIAILPMISCEAIKQSSAVTVGKKISIRCTAYSHGERDHRKYKKLAANGEQLKANHSIAARWDVFPVGTILRINNHNYTVDDYGSYIMSAPKHIPTIDVYQPTLAMMNDFGEQYFDNVEVVKMGSYVESMDILRERLHYAHCKDMYRKIEQKL